LGAEVGIRGDHAWLDLHAVLCSGFFQEPRGGFVSQSAGAEVHADPHAVLFIGEEIDVVISAANRAQLLASHFLERCNGFAFPGSAIKQGVIDPFCVAASHAEANRVPDLVHDFLDGGAKGGSRHVEQNGFVATGDIVANAAGTDGVSIGDDSADGHGVTLVVVGHQGHFVSGLCARLDLGDCPFIWRAPDRDSVDNVHSASSADEPDARLQNLVLRGRNMRKAYHLCRSLRR
jgi:hypothetical protein